MGPKMKKGAPKRSRRYKKMGSIGKITGTVCRLTHNDGIKRQSLNSVIIKIYPYILRKLYGMDVGKDTIISRKAKLDRSVNPKGIHIGSDCCILAWSGILSHDYCRSLLVDTYVGDHCIIGIRSLVLPGVKIGESCIIAACSVVTKDVPPIA